MKLYGYCRISTRKQNIERQVRNILTVFPDAIIIREIYTGTKFQGRKELEKLLKIVQTGDTIIFDSVSRMSRNADEGFQLYEMLYIPLLLQMHISPSHATQNRKTVLLQQENQ